MTPAVLRATAFKRGGVRAGVEQRNNRTERARKHAAQYRRVVSTCQARPPCLRANSAAASAYCTTAAMVVETKTSGRRGTNQNKTNGRTTFFFLHTMQRAKHNRFVDVISRCRQFEYLLLALEKFHFKKFERNANFPLPPKSYML